MTFSQFWADFLPNFASTILGILVGIPFALYVNRKIVNSQDEKTKKENAERVNEALKTIKDTLHQNEPELIKLRNLDNSGKFLHDSNIDISTWDAVKKDILNYLYNPLLKKKIAFHFSQLNDICSLNIRYMENPRSVKADKNGMLEAINSKAQELIGEVNSITGLIDEEIKKNSNEIKI